MFWGGAIITFLIIIFALLTVQIINPISMNIPDLDPSCKAAYESVWFSSIVLFQTLIAGDSWGRCSLPIIFAYPATGILFAAITIVTQCGVMNLILSAVVAAATDAQHEDRKLQL